MKLSIIGVLASATIAVNGFASTNTLDRVSVESLAASGAICERYDHHWESGSPAGHIDLEDCEYRTCLLCKKIQVMTLKWRDE